MSNLADEHSRVLGGIVCLGAALGVALFLYGISIEKGMGLIVPPFIPSPLGEMVEYRRSDARQSADLRRRHARQSDLQELASQHVGHVQN